LLTDTVDQYKKNITFVSMSLATPYVDKFLQGMATSGVALYNKIIGDVRSMNVNEFGLTSGAYNSAVIQDVAQTMSEFFDSPTYEKRLEDLHNSLPKISTEIVLASQKKFKRDLPPDLIDQLIKFQDTYADQLERVLMDENVEADIIAPFVNKAFYEIGNNSSLDSMVSIASDMKDAFVSYFITKVTTVVEQFERDMMATISNTFLVRRYLYKGANDDRCRPFCAERVGEVFDADTIEEWTLEDWDGKIPGTDATSIYVNLGGYNCRHILEPVI